MTDKEQKNFIKSLLKQGHTITLFDADHFESQYAHQCCYSCISPLIALCDRNNFTQVTHHLGEVLIDQDNKKAFDAGLDYLISKSAKSAQFFREMQSLAFTEAHDSAERLAAARASQRASKQSRLKDTAGYVYFLKADGVYKIGRTKNIRARWMSYEKTFKDIEYIAQMQVNDSYQWEKDILKKYADFRVSKNNEWLVLTDEKRAELESSFNLSHE